VQDPREAFEAAGLRFTRQRGAIYTALASVTTHPTADELFELVRRAEPSISLATVYNSLEALSEAGMCRRLPGAGDAFRFDADTSDHVHAVLPDGRVIDLSREDGRAVLESVSRETLSELERQAGIELEGVSIQLLVRGRPSHTG
jgi:Fe2+ or Zn2+ uptake regulation protein